ncbi:helix-turn-helix domain-containing protein [Nisaea acidiphila]|uniref:Helix-turn-helix domain-containing protein n=1 Tax=Nisaea acidiphila TaxID=1862145 RepID=A0A9J7AWJ6_9PROT|nr:IclR family transcriptional regulator C-terminal domain-containing protein [Nisaea acidiphila]UUX50817.1 helix-turn-helix domain-containing protein [Nisaea acidiphila]
MTALPKRSDAERSGQIQSVARAISVLNALAADEDGMTLTEIAHTVTLPPSTVHRLLTTLQQERYVRFDTERGAWQIGVQCFAVGNAFLRTRDLVAITRPYMRRLMEESGETVNLAVRDHDEMVYLAQVECREMMRAFAKPGARVPIAGSAVGKTLLARLHMDEVSKLLARVGAEHRTRRTIDALPRMEAELDRVRQVEFAIDNEEHSVGLRCVASAVFGHHSEPLAAISISGPTARITDDRIDKLGKIVTSVAKEATAALGGIWPKTAT